MRRRGGHPPVASRGGGAGGAVFHGSGEKGEERLRVVGSAEFLADAAVAQQPGNPRQRLEVIGTGGFRSQQQKDQIHRLLVDGLEIDRVLEACEQAVKAVQVGHLAVRNGDAVADAGGAQPLAFHKDVEDGPLVQPGDIGRPPGEVLQGLFLAGGAQIRDNGLGTDELVDFHDRFLALTPVWNRSDRSTRHSRRHAGRPR